MAINYSELTNDQLAVIEEYCKDNMKKLKEICYPIWGNKGLPSCYHDDLYDDAMKVLVESVVSYDSNKKASFKTFLINNIKLSQREWYRDTHLRAKRNNLELDSNGKIKKDENGNPIVIKNISFNAPTEDGTDLCEKIASNFIVEENSNLDFSMSEETEMFLDSLPQIARQIAIFIMNGYSRQEIKDRLNLSDKEYGDNWKIITSYEKKRVLFRENNHMEEESMNNTTFSTEDIAESYKNTSYSIDSISKQLRKKKIKDNHILQRHSGQWKSFAKSELVSDILRGKSLTQIIVSEEIKNGVRMQWLIDGKQRCTTLDDFLHDGFAVSKNVKNFNIRYQITKVDENGDEILNEEGFTETEFMEFDIRGKKFSQLPEELQEIFKDRQIPVLYNMNCTKKDIADDIARFNRSRPMNAAQNGWLGLDESFAELVENISKMPFFQSDFKGSAYTETNRTSGMIRRLIVEAIMVSDFIDEFKEFPKMCEFLSEEASDSNFTEFYALVERLTLVCDGSVADMFNATDSFLWLGLFSKFAKLGVDDKKFVDFMIVFKNCMKDKKANVEYSGTTMNSYNDLCINPKTQKSRATKDRNMVSAKMQLLEALMLDYLHIDKEDAKEINYKGFLKENVDDVTDEDIELIEMSANDISEVLDETSWMLSDQNYPSYLSIVGYAFREDKEDELKEWLPTYEKNNQFILNQEKSFLHMKESFEAYFQKGQVA